VGLGAALVDSLGEYGFERVVVPWMWIGIYTVLSMIAGVVAAIWPAWRASKLDILEAIAADG
jgi:putative ABC transport system permease protein